MHKKLQIEKYSLENQIALARTDSVYLILDLADSVIVLQIKGIPVRQCSVIHFRTNASLTNLKKKEHVVSYFSQPFIIKKTWSTLPKIPYQIKKAPKDTVEAGKYASSMIQPETGDIFMAFFCTQNLLISFDQYEPYSVNGFFKKNYRWTKIHNYINLYPLHYLKWPQPQPSVHLKVLREDAKAILRALPEHGQIIIRI